MGPLSILSSQVATFLHITKALIVSSRNIPSVCSLKFRMAHTTTTNFFIYLRDVQFTDRRHYYVPQFDDTISFSPHGHAIFTFIVSLLINLLQIKYQGKDASLFENQAQITLVAIASSLLIYCLSYYFVLKDSQHPSPSSSSSSWSWSRAFKYLTRATMIFSRPLTIAFLLSVLFPGPKSQPVFFALSIFISLIQLFGTQIKAILSWLKKAACGIILKWRNDDQSHNRGTRRGLISVQLSRVPVRSYVNRVHLLPL